MYTENEYAINKPIRLIELFGGIGSQAMALRDMHADFESYRLIEFDKHCISSYNAIHGTSYVPMDIRDVHAADLGIVDKDKYTYMCTYSFPCTDISAIGRMQGMSKVDWEQGKSTRSGLLWEVERIMEECSKEQLPDIMVMENVPLVHSKRNLSDFEAWKGFLRSRGYQSFCADLNAKDFGIPQSRNRCFMVSILADRPVKFAFPAAVKLEKSMLDMLEENVEDKYFVNGTKADKLLASLAEKGIIKSESREESSGSFVSRLTRRMLGRVTSAAACLLARDYKGFGSHTGNGVVELKRIQDSTCVGALSEAKWGKQPRQKDRVYKGDIAKCVIANLAAGSSKYVIGCRIRRLTPRECWRLMGYKDTDFDRAVSVGISDRQLYMQAGNAIVKQVLMAVFGQLHPLYKSGR